MMRRYFLDFLQAVERRIPPPPNCHHAITAAQFGSDEQGWEDKLALQVNVDGKFWCFFLEEDDFGRPPDEVAAEIEHRLANLAPDAAQQGVGPGQFICA